MLPIWKTEGNLDIQNEDMNNGFDAGQMGVFGLPFSDFQNHQRAVLLSRGVATSIYAVKAGDRTDLTKGKRCV